MPFETDFSNRVLNSFTEDKVYLTNVGCDIVVPDSKPDAIKIISVTARTDLKEVSVKKDRITFLGCVNYDIVYFSDSDSDRIRTITYQAPMSHQDDFYDFCDGDSVSAEAICHKCSFSLPNSRKISVSTPVEFKVYAIHNTMVDMANTDMCDYTLPCLTQRLTPINRVLCLNDRFSVEDTVTVEDFNVVEIIKIHSVITDKEYRIISNKTFVKGTLLTTIIFFDDEMKINSRTYFKDFSEVIETRNISDDMVADVSLEVVCVTAELFTDSGMSEIETRADIRVTLSGYEELDMDIIYDAYCPDCRTDIQKDKLDVMELKAIGEEKITLREIFEFDTGKCDKVCLTECDVKIKDKKIENEKIKTNAVLSLTLTSIGDSNSMLYTFTRDVDFESVTDAANCESGDTVHTRIGFGECDVKYLQGNKAEITVPVIMEHRVERHIQKEYIKSVFFDEGCMYDKSKNASITVHFASDDDNLWNIAKHYHTTVEDIVRVNNLDESIPLKKRQQLLIPKRI